MVVLGEEIRLLQSEPHTTSIVKPCTGERREKLSFCMSSIVLFMQHASSIVLFMQHGFVAYSMKCMCCFVHDQSLIISLRLFVHLSRRYPNVSSDQPPHKVSYLHT